MLQSFPLLAFNLAVFAVCTLVAGTPATPWYNSEAFTLKLTSGDVWHAAGGDVFLLFSLFLLLIEILRSTRSDRASIANHAFSVVVFVTAMVLFLKQPGYGNSTFIIFMAMTLVDVMAGFIITTVSARRDVSIQRTSGHGG